MVYKWFQLHLQQRINDNKISKMNILNALKHCLKPEHKVNLGKNKDNED